MVDVNEKEMHIQECKKYKKEETHKSPVQIEEYKRCPYC
jgi:hypothetical protein